MGRGRSQSGQAIVLIALMLTVLIGMVAIAIDGSRAYTVRRDLQDAVDAGALAAADTLQQSGSFVTAEQNATAMFGKNMRLYTAPACSGYGTPGAAAWTVTCTYSDGTVLTNVARALGAQGSRFQLSATRTLPLQFGRVLTNGTNPTLGAAAQGSVNSLAYTPTVAALDQGGCGGAGGTSITVNGTGTLSITGALVANGSVSVVAGSLRAAGDIYARCQASVSGGTNACYPSGAGTPCTFPDVAGATRSGFVLGTPLYPAPSGIGGSVGNPTNNVVVPPGIYATQPVLNGDHCWFLAGGVYTFPAGATNTSDFVSNELKPPDEGDSSNPTVRAVNQFWNTSGVNCAGAFQLVKQTGPRDLALGQWGFVVTSVRTDTYGGVSYTRESAPSMCKQINLNNHFDDIRLDISNVPGATSYNVYASPAPNACAGPFGLATNIPVIDPVQNDNTNPCPIYSGNGCSLGNEGKLLSSDLDAPFAPNGAASPGTIGSYPPDRQTAPLAFGLPNQNPARGAGAAGDRANENNCKSVANAYVTCPGPITPGAVVLNFPAGGCLSTGNGGDTYVFSGYQYNWVSLYSPTSNTCTHTLGAAGNSAWIGLVYAPSASISNISSATFSSTGTGGIIADTVSFTGGLPSITFSALYAPVPPAARITS
jgi:Flp pilus assembly protein TadG